MLLRSIFVLSTLGGAALGVVSPPPRGSGSVSSAEGEGRTPKPVVTSTSTGPASTNLRGFDISYPETTAFWRCAHESGYQKPVIKGYFQACRSGGAVDPGFLPSYQAARAAGFTNIDAYMFPCTGTQPTGVACKPVETQIGEFVDFIGRNHMVLGRLWLDVEPSSGECNGWNLGGTANFNLAKQWVAALKATGLKWGIYANAGQWEDMFPSLSSDIGSDLPLWAVQLSSSTDVGSVTRFMGGWTHATGKQYRLDGPLPDCGGSVDLDSFLN